MKSWIVPFAALSSNSSSDNLTERLVMAILMMSWHLSCSLSKKHLLALQLLQAASKAQTSFSLGAERSAVQALWLPFVGHDLAGRSRILESLACCHLQAWTFSYSVPCLMDYLTSRTVNVALVLVRHQTRIFRCSIIDRLVT